MNCPNCNNELKIPHHAERNMAVYQEGVLVKTKCCSSLVRCNPVSTYKAAPYKGVATEDDWGVKIETTNKETTS